jgi:hypothetical protein
MPVVWAVVGYRDKDTYENLLCFFPVYISIHQIYQGQEIEEDRLLQIFYLLVDGYAMI